MRWCQDFFQLENFLPRLWLTTLPPRPATIQDRTRLMADRRHYSTVHWISIRSGTKRFGAEVSGRFEGTWSAIRVELSNGELPTFRECKCFSSCHLPSWRGWIWPVDLLALGRCRILTREGPGREWTICCKQMERFRTSGFRFMFWRVGSYSLTGALCRFPTGAGVKAGYNLDQYSSCATQWWVFIGLLEF